MKKLVTLLFVCLAVAGMAQQSRTLAPSTGAPSVEAAPFIDPSIKPLSPPSSPQANTLELLYVDTVAQQFRYYVLPSFVNFDTSNDPGPQIFRDTMFALAQRYSAPTSFGSGGHVYLDSIFLIVFPVRWTDNTENKINITLHRQTSANGVFFPGQLVPGTDTISIFPDELLPEEPNYLMIPLPNHPDVGRNFFIQVSVPYDMTYGEDENNLIGLFGDSTLYEGSYVANLHRMTINGFWYRAPYAGFSVGGGEEYYGNLFMTAYVSDAKTGAVDDLELTGDALAQNYPNPFNPSTQIAFSLADGGMTTLKVYNQLGDEVASLVDGYQAAGKHEVRFDATELPSGTYYYTIKSGAFTSTKHLVLSK